MTPDEYEAMRSGEESGHPKSGGNGSIGTGIIGRALPHSLEAENNVLAVCLLDGESMVQRCVESGLDPASFYSPQHAIVFEALLRLRADRKPIETSILVEELKSARLLDQVGGIPFVLEISRAAPTTLQASYFIEKVREQAILRSLIRQATGAVEDAYGFSGDLPAFLANIDDRFKSILSADAAFPAGVISDWTLRRAGFGRTIKDDEPTMFLGKTAISNRGNIDLATAVRKSGKTAICGGMISAIIAGPQPTGDTLGFRSINPLEHAVIHFDTEQSPKDHETLLRTILRRAQVNQCPDWLYSYGVKGVSVQELRQRFKRLLRETNRRHKGVHSVALDGVSEFVIDPNDPKECNPLVTDFEGLSNDYNCTIHCFLHLNPPRKSEPTKGRGHLGSQLERKCETELRINTDADGIATVYTECARHTPIREKDGHRFSWDNAAQMHLTCGGASVIIDQVKIDKASETLDAVLHHAGKDRLRFADFLKAICSVTGIKASGAEDRLYQMKKFGLIEKDMLGFWGKSK